MRQDHEFNRVLRICFALLVLAFLLFIIVGDYAFTGRTPADWFRSKPTVQDLKNVGNELVHSIEEFKTQKGYYPESLQDANIVPTETYFGFFQYEVDRDGKSFRVYIGQMMRDGFHLTYKPESGWFLDS